LSHCSGRGIPVLPNLLACIDWNNLGCRNIKLVGFYIYIWNSLCWPNLDFFWMSHGTVSPDQGLRYC
jgi:hypothetical protein